MLSTLSILTVKPLREFLTTRQGYLKRLLQSQRDSAQKASDSLTFWFFFSPTIACICLTINFIQMRKYLSELNWNRLDEIFSKATDESLPEGVIMDAICFLIQIKENALADEQYEFLHDFHQMENKHSFVVMLFRTQEPA